MTNKYNTNGTCPPDVETFCGFPLSNESIPQGIAGYAHFWHGHQGADSTEGLERREESKLVQATI